MMDGSGSENGHLHILDQDLKPSKLILGDDERVRVLDFGLAKLFDPTGVADDGETMTIRAAQNPQTVSGTSLGTTPYMSPE
jgi:eukaryotic-like serine/threonine-protein kinase